MYFFLPFFQQRGWISFKYYSFGSEWKINYSLGLYLMDRENAIKIIYWVWVVSSSYSEVYMWVFSLGYSRIHESQYLFCDRHCSVPRIRQCRVCLVPGIGWFIKCSQTRSQRRERHRCFCHPYKDFSSSRPAQQISNLFIVIAFQKLYAVIDNKYGRIIALFFSTIQLKTN